MAKKYVSQKSMMLATIKELRTKLEATKGEDDQLIESYAARCKALEASCQELRAKVTALESERTILEFKLKGAVQQLEIELRNQAPSAKLVMGSIEIQVPRAWSLEQVREAVLDARGDRNVCVHVVRI